MGARLPANHPVRETSAARWREMYCLAPFPSAHAIARRLAVSPNTITAYLRRAGITIRTRTQQTRLEHSLGRAPAPPSWKGKPRADQLGLSQRARDQIFAFNTKRQFRKQRAEARQNGVESRKTRFEMPCSWCGTLFYVLPHHFNVNPRRCCCRSHGALFRRFRERGESVRPLILDQLVAGACPATIAATEAEIERADLIRDEMIYRQELAAQLRSREAQDA